MVPSETSRTFQLFSRGHFYNWPNQFTGVCNPVETGRSAEWCSTYYIVNEIIFSIAKRFSEFAFSFPQSVSAAENWAGRTETRGEQEPGTEQLIGEGRTQRYADCRGYFSAHAPLKFKRRCEYWIRSSHFDAKKWSTLPPRYSILLKKLISL